MYLAQKTKTTAAKDGLDAPVGKGPTRLHNPLRHTRIRCKVEVGVTADQSAVTDTFIGHTRSPVTHRIGGGSRMLQGLGQAR